MRLWPGLAAAANDIFENRELLDANRPARMELAGADADLGAHAELPAIGELRRSIVHHNRRIERGEESLSCARILGDDGIGVLRAIGGDVANRFLHAAYGAHRH